MRICVYVQNMCETISPLAASVIDSGAKNQQGAQCPWFRLGRDNRKKDDIIKERQEEKSSALRELKVVPLLLPARLAKEWSRNPPQDSVLQNTRMLPRVTSTRTALNEKGWNQNSPKLAVHTPKKMPHVFPTSFWRRVTDKYSLNRIYQSVHNLR